MYESEFHRERTLRFPIGIPAHCIGLNTSKLGQTPLDSQHLTCPSFCGNEIGKTLASNIPETLEMAIPENVDAVESSTSFKLQKIPLTSSIERKGDNDAVSSTTLIGNLNHPLTEHTTEKSKLNEQIQEQSVIVEKINSDANKISIQVEEPIEIHNTFKISSKSFLLPASANYSDKIDTVVHSSERGSSASSDIQKKSIKAKELLDTTADLRKQDLEPLLLSVDSANSTKFLENDIKSTFIKKTDSNRFDIPKPTNGNVEPTTIHPTTTTTTTMPTPNHSVAIEPTKSSCVLIYLMIRSGSFNFSLGSDEICHNFNITYNIPLSKYMKEDRFDLVFM